MNEQTAQPRLDAVVIAEDERAFILDTIDRFGRDKVAAILAETIGTRGMVNAAILFVKRCRPELTLGQAAKVVFTGPWWYR